MIAIWHVDVYEEIDQLTKFLCVQYSLLIMNEA